MCGRYQKAVEKQPNFPPDFRIYQNIYFGFKFQVIAFKFVKVLSISILTRIFLQCGIYQKVQVIFQRIRVVGVEFDLTFYVGGTRRREPIYNCVQYLKTIGTSFQELSCSPTRQADRQLEKWTDGHRQTDLNDLKRICPQGTCCLRSIFRGVGHLGGSK